VHKTLYQWKQAHPHVNVLAFEANYDKESGFGELEEVCGFCLASHYFLTTSRVRPCQMSSKLALSFK